MALLGVLGLAFLFTVVAELLKPGRGSVFLLTLLPAETGLLGAAVAYYFQGEATDRPEPDGQVGRLALLAILGCAFLTTVVILVLSDWRAASLFGNVEVVNAVLPTETALLGAAVAYYFQGGTRSSARERAPSSDRSEASAAAVAGAQE